jgi:bacterioferritin (cytochrome b1)
MRAAGQCFLRVKLAHESVISLTAAQTIPQRIIHLEDLPVLSDDDSGGPLRRNWRAREEVINLCGLLTKGCNYM